MTHPYPKRRFIIAMPLGLLAGISCVWFASKTNLDIWSSPLMWSIITDRMLIGLLVGLAGAYTHHPILGFPIPWYFRGFAMGIFASLTLAFGVLILDERAMNIFWMTLLAGGIYGIIIDFFATKFGGEGKNIAG